MKSQPIARLKLLRRPARERRSSERDRRLLEGTIKYQGRFFPVDILDLSEGGAFLSAPVLPDWSDSVTLVVCLPDGVNTVMISGRVRRFGLGSRNQGRSGFGLQFTRFFTSAGRESLRRHLVA